MKKEQKIIELRTAAKFKVAEIQTKIAFARSEAAEKRSGIMRERANELEGLEAGSTERFDVLAKYRAELADVEWFFFDEVASLKAEIQQTKSECEKMCAAAEDDPEPEKEQPQTQQETVYCDGSEHSARIVARRLINKMPHIPKGGSLNINIIQGHDGDYFVSVSELGCDEADYVSAHFFKLDGEKKEAAFIEKARRLFAEEPESGNSHVAEPLGSVLDNFFGGNPVEQVDNLIADTVKSGKEGENE